jgi:hypothetical protein
MQIQDGISEKAMNGDLTEALRQIEKEKEIPFESLLQTLELAMGKAYKKHYNIAGEVVVHMDTTSSKSQFKVFADKIVVDHIENEHAEILLSLARAKYDPNAQLGDMIRVQVNPESLGRIAAQTARQVMMQEVRETVQHQNRTGGNGNRPAPRGQQRFCQHWQDGSSPPAAGAGAFRALPVQRPHQGILTRSAQDGARA